MEADFPTKLSIHGKKVLIIGNWSYRNLGDELILLGTVKLLLGQHKDITVSCYDPKRLQHFFSQFIDTKQITFIHELPKGFRSLFQRCKKGGLKELSYFRSTDSVILGGGEIITEENPSAYRYWLVGMRPFLLRKMVHHLSHLYIMGGVQVPKGRFKQCLLRFLLNRTTHLYLRDFQAVEEIKEFGYPNTDFFMDTSYCAYERKGASNKNPYIIVNLNKNGEQFLDDIAQDIKSYLEKGYLIYFVPVAKGHTIYYNDLHYKHLLEQKVGSTLEILDRESAFSQFIQVIKNAEKVISTRLHLFLIASFLGVSTKVYPYQRKILKMQEVMKKRKIRDSNPSYTECKHVLQTCAFDHSANLPLAQGYSFPVEYQHKKIAILGYGAEGKSTFSFLLKHGISESQITILDKTLDEHYLQHLDDYDIIFKSAGIPYFPEIQAVVAKVITQVQFFFDHYQGKVIAITASKGKTTMTSLAYELVKNAGYQVKVVGNIGKPIFDEIDFDVVYDYVVIELSSYMLQTLKKQNFISLLGAIFPDHLDWHGGMEAYVKAKLSILEGSEVNIVFSSTRTPRLGSLENIVLCGKGTEYDWNADFFLVRGKPVFPLSEVQLLGEHNVWNISAVVALADILHINDKVLHQTIRNFQPVPHRLQKVGTFNGITFYDDAISTTPDSTIAALDALGEEVETIFLGGLDRGYDFSPLIARIEKSQIKNLVFFPVSGEKISGMLGEKMYSTLHTSSMEEAVKFAYEHTSSGKICLLSTASPSYSVRKNFEEKGDLFQQYIRQFSSVGRASHS